MEELSGEEAAPGHGRLCISLFGPFEARLNGLPLARLRSRKGAWLLALLALRHGREVDRDWLAATLWPEATERHAQLSLRVSLTDLRRALGPEAPRLHSPTPYLLCLGTQDAAVDVLAFDAAIAEGSEAALQRAVALHRGPLLEGCAEAWVLPERQAREEACLRALETLAARAASRSDPAAVEHWLRRAVSMDPLRESAQRALMQALAAGGSYAAALQLYRDLRQRLHRELNTEPDAETLALFEHLRADADRRRREQPAGPLSGEARPGPDAHRNGASPGAAPHPTSTVAVRTGPGTNGAHHPASAEPLPAPPPAAPSHNLPLQLTSFLGRRRERAELRQWLAAHRLVTLTGAGGCGKTRLALELAGGLREQYPHGVWLVELAALADPALVPRAVAAALDLPEAPGRSPTQVLIDALRPKALLLLLDNCEHLITACAHLAEALLQACPHLRILATSREPLTIAGERSYQVPSLSVPGVQGFSPGRIEQEQEQDPNARTPEHLLESEAVRLFVERAEAAAPGFALTPGNGGAVAHLCCRLDGIPLAIELAAARIKTVSVEKLVERLDDMFALLNSGRRTARPRHQTLRALIDWSYRLLSEAEQTLLRRLSVFAGGWTLEAAEAVAALQGSDEGSGVRGQGSDPELLTAVPSPVTPAVLTPASRPLTPCVLDLLSQLVEKSLVVYEEAGAGGARGAGEGRYRLLETMRQYARERLVEAGEPAAAHRRHFEYFLQLAEEAQWTWKLLSAEQAVWMVRLEREIDNLRAALAWSAEQADGAPALRLAAPLSEFWVVGGHWREGLRWLESALARFSPGSGGADVVLMRARAWAVLEAGRLALDLGDSVAAGAGIERGAELCRELGDPNVLGWALLLRFCQTGESSILEESAALLRQAGNRWCLAVALYHLGSRALRSGDGAAARSFYEESLAIARRLDDKGIVARPMAGLAHLARSEGDDAAARSLMEESLALRREYRDVWFPGTMAELGHLAFEQGDSEQAAALLEESLALSRERDFQWGAAWSLAGLAAVAQHRGDLEAARSLCEESRAISRALGETRVIARTAGTLALVAYAQGDDAHARGCLAESLALWRDMGDRRSIADCLERLVGIAESRGESRRAARLRAVATALRERLRSPLAPAGLLPNGGPGAAPPAAPDEAEAGAAGGPPSSRACQPGADRGGAAARPLEEAIREALAFCGAD